MKSHSSSRTVFLFIFFMLSALLLIATIITNTERKTTLSKAAEQKAPLYRERPLYNITGTIEALHADDFKNRRSSNQLFFRDDHTGEKSKLIITDNPDALFLSGTKVTIKKAVERIPVSSQSSVLTPSISPSPQLPLSKTILAGSGDIQVIFTPQLDTLGEQKILILLVKDKNVPSSDMISPLEIKELINKEVDNFHRKNSYNKFSINAEVIEKWYELEQEVDPHLEDFLLYIEKTIKKSIQDGYGKKLFESEKIGLIIQIEPNKDEVGRATSGKIDFQITPDRTINTSLFAILIKREDADSQVQVLGDVDIKTTLFNLLFSHELGHNLGAEHASAVYCPKEIVDTTMNYDFNNKRVLFGKIPCGFSDYGNYLDFMGLGIFGLYSNPVIKINFGWIDDDSSVERISLERKTNINKEFTLHTPTQPGLKWLVIDNAPFKYYLEYRERKEADSGVMIHIHEEFTDIRNINPLNRTLLLIQGKEAVRQKFYSIDPNFPIFVDKVHRLEIELKELDTTYHTARIAIRRQNGYFDSFDMNFDGNINQQDLEIILDKFGETGDNLLEDINNDEIVDIQDLVSMAQKIQRTFPSLPTTSFFVESKNLRKSLSFQTNNGESSLLANLSFNENLALQSNKLYGVNWNIENKIVKTLSFKNDGKGYRPIQSLEELKTSLKEIMQLIDDISNAEDFSGTFFDKTRGTIPIDEKAKKQLLDALTLSLSTFSDLLQ